MDNGEMGDEQDDEIIQNSELNADKNKKTQKSVEYAGNQIVHTTENDVEDGEKQEDGAKY